MFPADIAISWTFLASSELNHLWMIHCTFGILQLYSISVLFYWSERVALNHICVLFLFLTLAITLHLSFSALFQLHLSPHLSSPSCSPVFTLLVHSHNLLLHSIPQIKAGVSMIDSVWLKSIRARRYGLLNHNMFYKIENLEHISA